MSRKYLLKGMMLAGGSDFSESGRQFKDVEHEFPANNHCHARRISSQFNLINPILFAEIELSNDALCVGNRQKGVPAQ